jgi:hypothetical protein
VNITDAGFPLRGHLRFKASPGTSQMIGPQQAWDAKTVPKLSIRAAFRGGRGKAAVYWATSANLDFVAERHVEFRYAPDGHFHNYILNLASSPNYQGTISRLRFDPAAAASGSVDVAVESISWKTARSTTGARSSSHSKESGSRSAEPSARP